MRILLFFVLLTLFTSCEETWFYEYQIVNDTNHNVTIEAFDTDFPETQIKESIQIASKSSYSVFKAHGFHGEDDGIFKNVETDSVIINFENKKLIIQTCNLQYGFACQFNRNIMDYNNRQDFIRTKTGKSNGNNEYRFTYTITEEDYNNAEEIEK